MTATVVLTPIHFLLLLLVILASYVSAEHYYIVLIMVIFSQCQNYSTGTCFTLAEFVSTSNSGYYFGGAISVNLYSNISSTNDHYINNSAGYGGAIYVFSGNIASTNDHYINNSADFGGATYVNPGNIYSANDHYIYNGAGNDGGAIYVYSGNDYFTNNSAEQLGGDTKLSGDKFEHNSAGEGGVIYKTGGALVIGQSNITDNFDSSKYSVYMSL